MQYNRQLIISTANNRKSLTWQQQHIWWADFVDKLKSPVRSRETLDSYLKLPKSKQDDLKDVGGFVGGAINGRRKACNVIGRDLVTLDLDNIKTSATKNVLQRVDSLNCAYVVYSTRKHSDYAPRIRVIIPLDRTVNTDEYEPIARKLAELIGIELCDMTTFDISRLMYYPSCCADSQYVYHYADKPFVDATGILNMYTDWRNVSEWCSIQGFQQKRKNLQAKQGNPTDKQGVVGAFCRTYDVYAAIEKFIPGTYIPCDDGRYTYYGGSTTGGAIIYDDGLFIYSHHATDPISGLLCNAFDLVRLHMYKDLDNEVKPDTPTNRVPSFLAMCQLAVSDSAVSDTLNKERYLDAQQEFNNPMVNDPENNLAWMNLLEKNKLTGLPLKTTKNVRIMLDNDINLKGKIKKDDFSGFIFGVGALPWSDRVNEIGVFRWTDSDDSGLRDYVEQVLKFRVKDVINDAFNQTVTKNKYNPVHDFLKATVWDGVPRLDTIFIDYLGAEDCEYTRVVTRKMFTAAVARVMQPGIKFDTMLVIDGKQGQGKSTIISKMGMQWFSDSIQSFEGKEAAELLQGTWLIEIGEMEAYSKSDINAVKHFLSKCHDHYRGAYDRHADKHLRKCVFFGTTNDRNYLKDPTGNRRFWPISTNIGAKNKDIFTDLDQEIPQIWAEAYARWQSGEPLILGTEMEKEAEKRRENHFDRDPWQGQIEEFLDKPIPHDWDKWSIDKRRMFWNGQAQTDSLNLIQRDKVCAIEIWTECLGAFKNVSRADSNRITKVLRVIKGWQQVSTIRFGADYGIQKGFKRLKT